MMITKVREESISAMGFLEILIVVSACSLQTRRTSSLEDYLSS
jgi:hypothetical protein